MNRREFFAKLSRAALAVAVASTATVALAAPAAHASPVAPETAMVASVAAKRADLIVKSVYASRLDKWGYAEVTYTVENVGTAYADDFHIGVYRGYHRLAEFFRSKPLHAGYHYTVTHRVYFGEAGWYRVKVDNRDEVDEQHGGNNYRSFHVGEPW